MFAKLVLVVAMAGVLLSGCAYRGHDGRMGVSVNRGGYYDAYYEASYGRFNDGHGAVTGPFVTRQFQQLASRPRPPFPSRPWRRRRLD